MGPIGSTETSVLTTDIRCETFQESGGLNYIAVMSCEGRPTNCMPLLRTEAA
jgi:hypothetical protein